MTQLTTCSAMVLALAGVAGADFTGPYDHALWTLNVYGGDGSAIGDATSLVLTGNNAGFRMITTYTIKAPGDGTFAFDWSYTCDDEFTRLDTAGFVIAGVVYKVAEETGESGSISVAVLEGDSIGFFVDTSDGLDQPGVLTVTGFNGPTPSGAPLGACCMVQPGCVDEMFQSECIRMGGTYMGDGTLCADVDCGPEPPEAQLLLVGENLDLTTLSNCSAGYPTLAFNRQDDEFLLVWEEASLAAKTSIAAQRVSADGSLVGSPATIVLAEGWQVTPTTAYNVIDNEYMLAWRWQGGGGDPDFNATLGQRFGADLTALGPVFQLTTTGVGFEGSLLHNPLVNEFVAVARRYSPEPGGIFGSRIAGDAVIDPSLEFDTIQGMGFGYPAPCGGAAYNSLDNQYLSTYAVQAYPTWSAFNVRGRLCDADGTMAGPPFEISFAPNFRPFYHAATAAFDPNAGRYLVAYGDARSGLPLRGQFVGREGTLFGLPFALSEPMVAADVGPILAFDPVNDVYLLAWCENPIANSTRILVQLLAANGAPFGDAIILTTTAYHMPFVGANANGGGFLVVWRDKRNYPTSTDIYGQLIGVEISDCPADFDGDGDVDTADLLYLLANWGTPNGDVDGDGDTDTSDLLALLAAWGDCP